MSALKKASGPLLMLSFVLTVLSTWVPGTVTQQTLGVVSSGGSA